jgi:hypothetical protein
MNLRGENFEATWTKILEETTFKLFKQLSHLYTHHNLTTPLRAERKTQANNRNLNKKAISKQVTTYY